MNEKISKRSIKNKNLNFLLNGFGLKFYLKVKPINYTFMLSNASDCFFNGHVNNDLNSRVYINLCQPNKMVRPFNFFFKSIKYKKKV